jgi:signal transduction histidine kinase
MTRPPLPPLTAESAAQKARLVALGEMTGGIAHDFRNLLAAIESGLRLAEKSLGQPEKLRVYIAAAREGIDRGVKLTSQLLAFAKRQEVEARARDVNKLLRNLELLLKYSAGPETRIVLELASDIPTCLIDPSRFDAAVLNLVVNARDAMPHGGEVRISTERWVTTRIFPNKLRMKSRRQEKVTMLVEQEARTLREAVGVFNRSEDLQDAIDELLSSGRLRSAARV